MHVELALTPRGRGVEGAAVGSGPTRPAMRAAYVLSTLVAVLMAIAASAGLWVHGLYRDIPWASAALRGGDLATLTVAVPVLVAALVSAARGAQRAQLVWAGMLGYSVYNYAYVAFGAEFNDLFLLHIVVLSLSIWALICLLPSLDTTAIAARFGPRTPARWVAGMFGLVTLGLTGMWTYFILRQVITGELPAGAAPPAALHLVYATDLTIFVSSLAVATVLLWRRTTWGYLLGTIMSVTGAAYLINLMSAAAFQANAHVEGATAFSPFSLMLDLAFVVASVAMLGTMSPAVSGDDDLPPGDGQRLRIDQP
jgi:hypothetical protein